MQRVTRNTSVGRKQAITHTNKMEGVPALARFDGSAMGQEAKHWYENLERLSILKKWSGEDFLNTFPMYLTGAAVLWYNTLDACDKDTKAHLKAAFFRRFQWSVQQKQERKAQFFRSRQQETESSDVFINRMITFAQDLGLDDDSIMAGVMAGLKEEVHRQVRMQRPSTIDDVRAIARLADCSNDNTTTTTALKEVVDSMQRMFAENDKTRKEIAALQEQFSVAMVSRAPSHPSMRYQQAQQGNSSNVSLGIRAPSFQNTVKSSPVIQGSQARDILCHCCGLAGHKARQCKHRSKACNGCGVVGHLARVCRRTAFQAREGQY